MSRLIVLQRKENVFVHNVRCKHIKSKLYSHTICILGAVVQVQVQSEVYLEKCIENDEIEENPETSASNERKELHIHTEYTIRIIIDS